MARSPASAAVAEALRAAMKHRGLSGVELANRLAKTLGYKPGEMWISKRRRGEVHLVVPKVVEWEATEELKQIAQAIGVDVAELVAAANKPQPTN